jgi:DVNP family
MTDKIKAVGSKAEVFHGSAKHTSGGLHKKDLVKNKAGRIVSRKKMAAGKKAIQRLFKLGYKPTKGTFKAMRKGMRTTRRSRGGSAMGSSVAANLSSILPSSGSSALAPLTALASTGSPAAAAAAPKM